jgi:hypothetical protein
MRLFQLLKTLKMNSNNFEKSGKVKSQTGTQTWFRRIGLWTAGISSYYIFTWIYDYLIIAAFVWYLGPLKGGVVAMIVSMFIDFFTLKFYDWLKKDWLALETIKELDNQKGFIGKLFMFVHNKGAALTVFSLSLFLNAFIVTTYMRKGAYQYNGLTKRDWVIFTSSSLIGNGYWILIFAGGITIIKEFIMKIF